jgi:pimeloyl-ACP methyl ester carboxylesterase
MQANKDLLKTGDLPLKFQPVDGTSLGYLEKGDGDAVVFVHGALTDLRIWLDQVELFSHKFRAISYSRRCHWPAGHPEHPMPYSRSLHAKDLIDFLDALEIKKAHLVGHSYGGAVALLAAIERPDLIMSLTLGEPSPFLGLFDGSEADLISRQKIGFDEARLLAQIGKPDAAVRKFLSVIVGADVLDQLTPTARSIVLENVTTLAPMLEHYYESSPVSCDQLKRMEMTAHTLLVSGELSPRLALISNNKLSACLPNSSDVILRSTSHGLHIEDPAAFNQVVLDFLEGLASTEWEDRPS